MTKKTIIFSKDQLLKILSESNGGFFNIDEAKASLGDIYQKYYSDIPQEDFTEIVEADPTAKNGMMGKFGKWLLALYKNGNLKMEDLYKASEYLSYFVKFNARIQDKDINHYTSLPALYNAVKPFIDDPDQATSHQDEIRRIKEDAEKFYEDDRWLVIIPLTKEASCYYGKGTQWCTAADRSENMFDSYNSKGRLYINIDKKKNRKYQFHFETGFPDGYMDESNYPIGDNIADSIGLSPELIKKYAETKGIGAFVDLVVAQGDDAPQQVYQIPNMYVVNGSQLYRIDTEDWMAYPVYEGSEYENILYSGTLLNRFIPIGESSVEVYNIIDSENGELVGPEEECIIDISLARDRTIPYAVCRMDNGCFLLGLYEHSMTKISNDTEAKVWPLYFPNTDPQMFYSYSSFLLVESRGNGSNIYNIDEDSFVTDKTIINVETPYDKETRQKSKPILTFSDGTMAVLESDGSLTPYTNGTNESESKGKNENLLTEDRESKNISFARRLLKNNGMSDEEAQKVLNGIRTDIPNSRLAQCRFLLGITRMFLNKEIKDYNTESDLNQVLPYVASDAHIKEYDYNLNGLSAQDLINRFKTNVETDIENDKQTLAKNQYGNEENPTNGRYEVVRIASFEEAEKYSDYTEWCITKAKSNYESYTKGGTGIFYFLLREGWKEEEKVHGEGYPLDSYGMSMIAVSVNPNGSLNTSTIRWNHGDGNDGTSNDNMFTTHQLSQLVGRNFYEVFQPRTEEEVEEIRVQADKPYINALRRIKSGYSADSEFYLVYPIIGDYFMVVINMNDKYRIFCDRGRDSFYLMDGNHILQADTVGTAGKKTIYFMTDDEDTSYIYDINEGKIIRTIEDTRYMRNFNNVTIIDFYNHKSSLVDAEDFHVIYGEDDGFERIEDHYHGATLLSLKFKGKGYYLYDSVGKRLISDEAFSKDIEKIKTIGMKPSPKKQGFLMAVSYDNPKKYCIVGVENGEYIFSEWFYTLDPDYINVDDFIVKGVYIVRNEQGKVGVYDRLQMEMLTNGFYYTDINKDDDGNIVCTLPDGKTETYNKADFFQFGNPFKDKKMSNESVIRESVADYDNPYWEYMDDYGVRYVLDTFLSGKYKTEPWGVLINPSMYAKALSEFQKFGTLDKFPTKYVYQWMGIIMKNTAMLRANTELAGHSQAMSYEELSDFLESYSDKKGKKYFLEGYNDVYEQSNLNELLQELESFYLGSNEQRIVNELTSSIQESINEVGGGVHTYGNLKGQGNLFMDQDEVQAYDKERKEQDEIRKYESVVELTHIFNNHNADDRKYRYSYVFDTSDKQFYKSYNLLDFLDDIGLYDWMTMPDGTDAWSDYGIKPIEKIIGEYDSNDEPEKILVLVNRILDIYHQRGDLSSIFIEGGAKSLTNISNKGIAEKKNRRVVVFTEQQLNKAILSENRESKNISLARKYLVQTCGKTEQSAQSILDGIRHFIPSSRVADCKFLLGITRMFQNGELENTNVATILDKALLFIAQNKVGEFDYNLNGLTARSLIQSLQEEMSNATNDIRYTVNQQTYKNTGKVSNNGYRIIRIDSFKEASKYKNYTDWCICSDERSYMYYTKEDTCVFYFCLKNGYRNVPEEVGENAPYDAYGMSMLAVCVDPSGNLYSCTTRWNHDNKGGEHSLNTEEISQLIGKNFYDVFKPKDPSVINEQIYGEFLQKYAYFKQDGNLNYFVEKRRSPNNVYALVSVRESGGSIGDRKRPPFFILFLESREYAKDAEGNPFYVYAPVVLSDDVFEYQETIESRYALLYSIKQNNPIMEIGKGVKITPCNAQYAFYDNQMKSDGIQLFNLQTQELTQTGYGNAATSVSIINGTDIASMRVDIGYIMSGYALYDCTNMKFINDSSVLYSNIEQYSPNNELITVFDKTSDKCNIFNTKKKTFVFKDWYYDIEKFNQKWATLFIDYDKKTFGNVETGKLAIDGNFIIRDRARRAGTLDDIIISTIAGPYVINLETGERMPYDKWEKTHEKDARYESKKVIFSLNQLSEAILSENRESKNVSLARRYAVSKGYTQEQFNNQILTAVRNDIPSIRIAEYKFMLGVTRMIINGELNNGQTIMGLNKAIRLMSTPAHVNEYDNDMNGQTASEIIETFQTVGKEETDQEREELSQATYNEPDKKYNVVRINSFEDAERYSNYVKWCITYDNESWNNYTQGGEGLFYFLLQDGFERVPRKKGENAPLDDYGLSMIAISVDTDGNLATATCRWNHDMGGNDNVLNTKQISELIGKNFYEVFKPRTKEEIEQMYIDKVSPFLEGLKKVNNGMDINKAFPIAMKISYLNFNGYKVCDKPDYGAPVAVLYQKQGDDTYDFVKSSNGKIVISEHIGTNRYYIWFNGAKNGTIEFFDPKTDKIAKIFEGTNIEALWGTAGAITDRNNKTYLISMKTLVPYDDFQFDSFDTFQARMLAVVGINGQYNILDTRNFDYLLKDNWMDKIIIGYNNGVECIKGSKYAYFNTERREFASDKEGNVWFDSMDPIGSSMVAQMNGKQFMLSVRKNKFFADNDEEAYDEIY